PASRARRPTSGRSRRSKRAAARDHRPHRPRQHIEVEPRRPVADVVSVERLLVLAVALAADGHLPDAGDAGADALAQLAELGSELLEVVVGKRSWPHEAHVALDHAPQLRKLVDAVLSEEAAEVRHEARIVTQLAPSLPLLRQLRVLAQVLGEPTLGVRLHGAD